jgi:hypothetical protein
MSHHSLIDSVTERIFFFTLTRSGYEARVVPVEHGLPLAAQTEYKIVNKAKQASWYTGYHVDAKTHTILVRAIAPDAASTKKLITTLVPSFAISVFSQNTIEFVPKTRGTGAGLSYIYLDVDDKTGIRQFFAARPEGRWRMALGTDENPNASATQLNVALSVMGLSMIGESADEVRASIEWWMQKIEHGEFECRPCGRLPFPSGLIGYCNYVGWPEHNPSDPALLTREEHLADMVQEALNRAIKDAERLDNDPEKIDAFLKKRRHQQRP